MTRNGGNVLWVVYVCVGVRVRVLCAVVLCCCCYCCCYCCCCCCSPAATHTSTNKIASFFLSFFLQVPSAGPRYELLHYPSEAYAGTIRRGRRNRPQGRRFMAGRRSGENLTEPPTFVFRHSVHCVVLCILLICVHTLLHVDMPSVPTVTHVYHPSSCTVCFLFCLHPIYTLCLIY